MIDAIDRSIDRKVDFNERMDAIGVIAR